MNLKLHYYPPLQQCLHKYGFMANYKATKEFNLSIKTIILHANILNNMQLLQYTQSISLLRY